MILLSRRAQLIRNRSETLTATKARRYCRGFNEVAGALLVAFGRSRRLFTDRTRTVAGPRAAAENPPTIPRWAFAPPAGPFDRPASGRCRWLDRSRAPCR